MEYQVILTLRTDEPTLTPDRIAKGLESLVNESHWEVYVEVTQVSEPYDLK